jgi:hypothetical protein
MLHVLLLGRGLDWVEHRACVHCEAVVAIERAGRQGWRR